MEALRKARRAAELVPEGGLSGVIEKIVARLRRATGLVSAQQKAWDDRKRLTDQAFDGSSGADTGGIQRLFGLSVVGPNARHGVSHIASDPDDFTRAIDALEVDLRDYAFVDLGSGKGRAVLMAARLPFRKIVGVEFAAELHAVARANLAALPAADQARVSLVHDDAVACALPEGPLVVYLYHPFGPAIIRPVATRLLDECRATGRAMRVVYVNPQHADVWLEVGWVRTTFGQSYVVFEPPSKRDESIGEH